MNILLIAPYRTYSGWGEGGKHLAKALNTMGDNLAIRPIYMSNEIDTEFNDEELLSLEQASYNNYDVVIQRVLPHYFCRVPHSLSVLASVFETKNIQSTPWWRYINMADAILVPSKIEKQDLKNNKSSMPVYNISEAIDISKYDKDYEQIPELKDTFNFYFIGEFIERKHLEALLIAFHREFKKHEPVKLVIKTTGNYQQINDYIISVKSTLRIYQSIDKYHAEMLICGRFTQHEMHNLHRSCHCFVMPSYGEAYCRPVVDALGYGNSPIVTDNTGMTDYITNDNGFIAKSTTEPIYTKQPPISDIYTAKELWSRINILDLQKCMREAYNNPKSKCDMTHFSYTTIGQNIKKVLNAITN